MTRTPKIRRVNKKEIERDHFKRAMRLRFQLDISDETISEIVANIRKRKTTLQVRLIEKKTNTRSLYEVILFNTRMMIIYDNKRHELITVLPKNNLESYKLNRTNY